MNEASKMENFIVEVGHGFYQPKSFVQKFDTKSGAANLPMEIIDC